MGMLPLEFSTNARWGVGTQKGKIKMGAVAVHRDRTLKKRRGDDTERLGLSFSPSFFRPCATERSALTMRDIVSPLCVCGCCTKNVAGTVSTNDDIVSLLCVDVVLERQPFAKHFYFYFQ